MAFFTAQEPACQAHAERFGNPAVDPTRFAGAKLVQRNADATTLIEDGAGTQLISTSPARRSLPTRAATPRT
ncbi:MAG TPA: hypothetical protein VGN22_14320 [Pseudonocardia sp.]